jgi:hypothetical protein
MNVKQRITEVRSRVSSNIHERTKSFVSSITAPFQYGWNYIANIWRTTPVWNRFFWWSLSAIAVYGIATTLPTQLIKLAITKSTMPHSTTETRTAATENDDTQPPKHVWEKPNIEPEN